MQSMPRKYCANLVGDRYPRWASGSRKGLAAYSFSGALEPGEDPMVE